MKKLSLFLVAILLTVGTVLPAFAATEPDFEVAAEAIYLYNLDEDIVVYEKNADEQRVPASLTKIMTAILAIENTPDLDSEIVTYPMDVQEFLYTYQLSEGAVSSAGLVMGEEMTMREYLYAMLLPSGNEAAMCIAEHIGGTQEDFAAMMTAKAQEIGAINTTFLNANGLYAEGHVTTAYDMALITRYAMELPDFMEIVSTYEYTISSTNKHPDGLTWTSTNEMMNPESSLYYEGLAGIKTGTLEESGRCFISTATRNDYNYLLVVMGAPYLDENGSVVRPNSAFSEATQMYNWAFTNFSIQPLVDKGKVFYSIPVRFSMDTDEVQLIAETSFSALVSADEDVNADYFTYEIPESLDAPVKSGDYVGEVVVRTSNGEELGRVSLIAAENVESSSFLIMTDKMKQFTSTFGFKVIVTFVVLLIIAYIIIMVMHNNTKKRRSASGKKRPTNTRRK